MGCRWMDDVLERKVLSNLELEKPHKTPIFYFLGASRHEAISKLSFSLDLHEGISCTHDNAVVKQGYCCDSAQSLRGVADCVDSCRQSHIL